MKIVISESQYHSLFKSQDEKNSNLIYKMWNDGMDIYEISELLGMKETQVVVLLKDKEINIDCGFADYLIPILYKTNLLNRKEPSEVLILHNVIFTTLSVRFIIFVIFVILVFIVVIY